MTNAYIARVNGKPYKPLHPLVSQFMKETYGLPIYQEQTLVIVREIGGFDWEETTKFRKGMAKSFGAEHFTSLQKKFQEGAKTHGFVQEQSDAVWSLLIAMGSYQFNKAHSRSYAVVSIWTAWLKAHHPLEFAAANLRNIKDEENALALLREMVTEGLKYVPFDPANSEEDWCVKDGKLYAGIMALHGYGPAKAKKFAEARIAGKLTQKQIDHALSAKSVFAEPFPVRAKFKEYYENPASKDVKGKVYEIAQIEPAYDCEYVFIGRLAYKAQRDSNEEVLVKRREGKRHEQPTTMLDMRLIDDSGQIMCRVDRFSFHKIGRPLMNVEEGSFLLVRARFSAGIRFGFIQKVKVLE